MPRGQIVTEQGAACNGHGNHPTDERVAREPSTSISTSVGARGIRERAEEVHRQQRHPGEAADVAEVSENGDNEASEAMEGEL